MSLIMEQVGQRNIWIKSRDKDGNPSVRVVEDFMPYFYDDNKKKIFVDSPGDIKELRKKYKKTYEADITYVQRYIIDRMKVPLPEEPIRICYFDIETNKCLDTKETPEPIISIAFYDSFMKRFVVFVWREDLKTTKEKMKVKFEELEIDEDVSVYKFSTEEDMLNKVIEFIDSTDPDIIAGWNSGGEFSGNHPFDFPYLLNRMDRLNLKKEKLSPLRRISIEEYWNRVSIKGRIAIDLKEAYKKRESSVRNSLDFVSKEVLGKKKLEIEMKDIWKDIDNLVKYNIVDVYLTKEIDENKKLIEGFNNLRRITGCVWSGLVHESMITDSLILKEAKRKGMILPTKKKNVKKKYKGGFVHKVNPGLHKNVVVMDLKSLYPSLICQFNISFDTIKKEAEEGDITLGNGAIFRQDVEGLGPSILKNLFILRQLYKDERKKHKRHSPEWETYESLQYATKRTANALYGQYGSEKSRYYASEAAGSITWLGRETILWTIKFVEEKGLKVIYADTDSVFIDFNKKPQIDDINLLLKQINESYSKFVQKFGMSVNSYLQLDFEGIYSSIWFTNAKKRYVGWLTNDGNKDIERELKVKGFEMRRKDQSMYGKNIQKEIFEMLLDEKNKEEIDRYVLKKRAEMKKCSITQIAISKRITKELDKYTRKNAIHKGAEFANEYLGENFGAGSEMYFIYCNEVKVGSKWWPIEAICFSHNNIPEVKVDWEKMAELNIDNKVEKIYESAGWNAAIGNTTMDKWLQ